MKKVMFGLFSAVLLKLVYDAGVSKSSYYNSYYDGYREGYKKGEAVGIMKRERREESE